ncbi:unnamed protein product, partial [Symbiodinium sp. CCMP2456]
MPAGMQIQYDAQKNLLDAVTDEERSQNKGFNCLLQRLAVVGFVDNDICHCHWNCFKRAVTRSKFEMVLMKCTIACNFNHGSFLSAENFIDKRQALQLYPRYQPRDYFRNLAESIAQVKNKAWFLVNKAMRQLIWDWTVQREGLKAVLFMQEKTAGGSGNKTCNEAWSDEEQGEDDAPRNRRELYEAYAGQGPAAMVLDFLEDTQLKKQVIVLEHCARPLERAYHRDLKLMAGKGGEQLAFAASRAEGTHHWFQTAVECLMNVQSPALMNRLGMTPKTGKPVNPEMDAAWLKDELALLQEIHTLSVCLAKEVVWSNLHFYLCLPEAIALALLPAQSRDAGMEHLRSLTQAVLKAEATLRGEAAGGQGEDQEVGEVQAEAALAGGAANGQAEDEKVDVAALAELMDDLSWRIEPLPRILMRNLCACDFDATDAGIALIARRMYAGTASSKDTLESCFNWMNRQVGYMCTNQKTSDAMKWFLASLNPYGVAAGADGILPSENDWWTCWQSPAGRSTMSAEFSAKIFDVNSTKLPELPDAEAPQTPKPFPTPRELADMSWKAAGSAARQRAVAAAAFLLKEVETQWENLPKDFVYLDAQSIQQNLQTVFLFNFSCSDTMADEQFLHVPVRLVPRCCLGGEVGHLASAYEVYGPMETMLRAAVRDGLLLTNPQLNAVIGALGLPGPEKKTGSGTNRNIVKTDLCQYIIAHLFPSADENEKRRMLSGMLGTSKAKWKDQEASVVKMVAQLDPDNAKEFEPLVRHAKTRIEQKLREEGEANAEQKLQDTLKEHLETAKAKWKAEMADVANKPSPADASSLNAPRAPATPAPHLRAEPAEPRRTGVTPPDFKSLLPGKGTLVGEMFGKHNGDKRFYKVEYK